MRDSKQMESRKNTYTDEQCIEWGETDGAAMDDRQ